MGVMIFMFGLLVGIVLGMAVFMFFQGATKNNRESEIYKEGFNNGYNAGINNSHKWL